MSPARRDRGAPLSAVEQPRWAAHYRRLHGPLVAHARRHGADPLLAEDVAHEAMLLLLVHRRRRGRPSWPRLAQLVERRVEHHLAVRDREASLTTASGVVADGPDATVDVDLRLTAVAQALARLSAEDETVLLHQLDDWTARELAELLGTPPDEVGPAVARALRRLRAAVQDVADRLAALPGTVVGASRRAWAAAQRTQATLAEHAAASASWLRLDPVHAVSMLLGTAAGLSLAAAVGAGTGALFPHGDAAVVTVEVTRPATADDVGEARKVATAPQDRPSRRSETPHSAPLSVVRIVPAVAAQPEEGQTNYSVAPVRTTPSHRDAEYPATAPGVVIPPIDFECPPPEERPPVPALGCPVLEAVG